MKKYFLVAAVLITFCLNTILFLWPKERKHVDTKPPISYPGITPVDPVDENPGVQPRLEIVPTFVNVPESRKHSEDSIYGDIMSHVDKPFGDQHGRSTNSHESGHGIHSYLRNKYTREMEGQFNGFYALEGRGVIIEEPNIKKSDINDFVPKNLRSYRYDLYLAGQKEWDDVPLYIYDEWNAYVIGGMTNVEDVHKGRHKGGWTDGVSGCLGFSIYAVATCMAVKENDPNYWENNLQFRNFTIWLLRRSQKTFMLGREMEEFSWEKQESLLNELLTSSSAETMREFMREHLLSVWLDAEVLHGAPYRPTPKLRPGCEQCKRGLRRH